MSATFEENTPGRKDFLNATLMNMEENKYDLIEDYILGNLEGTVKKDFEDLLKKDAELQESVKEYQLMIEGTKYTGRKELLGTLKEIESNRKEKQKSGTKHQILYLAIAAGIALLVTFYIVIENTLQKSPAVIAEAYYEPYPALYGYTTRGEQNPKTDFEKAMNYYESSNYKEALKLLTDMKDPEKQELINFYLANTYLALDQFEDCESIYKDIMNNGETFQSQAEWFLAIAYLKDDKVDQAVPLLQDLVSKNSDFSEKSDKLLKSINYQP